MIENSGVKDQHGQDDNATEITMMQPSSRVDEVHTIDSAQKLASSPSNPGRRRGPSSEHLHRQGYIILLVLMYAAIFVAGWSILVVTSKHPIGRKSYDCFNDQNFCPWSSSDLQKQNVNTSWYMRKAQTLLATVSLLTIPLTSAVCAAAVVPWLQQSGQDMSLRQLITLSDKGWTSPYTYYRLLTPSGWKRYGSSFVLLALLLHALGAALSPAISQASAVVTIKVPSSSPTVTKVRNLLQLQEITQGSGAHDHKDDPATVLRLRSMLKDTNLDDSQVALWSPHSEDCANPDSWENKNDYRIRSRCSTGGFLTYRGIANATGAWQSQLSNGFSTGIKTKQYLPRINSSVSVELLTEMPQTCVPKTAALLLNYTGTSGTRGTNISQYVWSVQVCILDYSTTSLFNRTDDAQTLVETVYLDLYTSNIMDRKLHNITKVTISTTAGYFELPNYSNGNIPGSLLTKFRLPDELQTKKRKRQPTVPQMPDDVLTLEDNATLSVPGIANLELLPRKGPLLNIIYALFGNGSLPATYLTENATYNSGWSGETGDNPCLDLIPLTDLFNANDPEYSYNTACLDWWGMSQGSQMHSFLSNFFLPPDRLERVFKTAAYMSHSIWLGFSYGELFLAYDAGRDMQKPGLTDNSIIALTIAIAVFLLSLLSLAIYASFSRTWTYSLDAYALLRIGADLGREALPFLMVRDADRIGELDELPGWVGDTTEADDCKARQLGMGWNCYGPQDITALRTGERYLSYPRRPTSIWKFSDYLIEAISCFCGLGGLLGTNVGSKLYKARERYRRSSIERREKRKKRYMEWRWRSAWERFWLYRESETSSKEPSTYSSLDSTQTQLRV